METLFIKIARSNKLDPARADIFYNLSTNKVSYKIEIQYQQLVRAHAQTNMLCVLSCLPYFAL
jgi:hypothetical protein